MGGLTSLPHGLDVRKRVCRAIVETPKGSRSKFAYDPESDLFLFDHLLPEGLVFPFDFGFVPSTLGEDGDPIDVLVLMDAPVHAGCLIDMRIIGVINARQVKRRETQTNDRIVGVAIPSYERASVQSLRDLGRAVLGQVEDFFTNYNRQRGKTFKITGTGGPKQALSTLKIGIDRYASKQKDHAIRAEA